MLALKYLSIFHISWHENVRAHILFWLETLMDDTLDRTYIEYLETPSIEKAEIQQVDHEPSWMDRFIRYLTNGTILDNPPEGKKFKWMALSHDARRTTQKISPSHYLNVFDLLKLITYSGRSMKEFTRTM